MPPSETSPPSAFVPLVAVRPYGRDIAAEHRNAARVEALRRLRWLLPFLLVVALPTAVASLYFGTIAAARYEAEARFVVRTPTNQSLGSLNSILRTTDIGAGTDDAYAVQDFILSRDAMHRLMTRIGLTAKLSAPGSDWPWQFPNFLVGRTEEALYQHYLRFVSVYYAGSSGISTLRVQAFTAEDAREIAATLLDEAELLVNRLNERAHQDAIRMAQQEVDRSRTRALAAQEGLTEFRSAETMVDPVQLSRTVMVTIGKLLQEMVETNAQIEVLGRSSPQSPQIAALKNRSRALQAQIDEQKLSLAGNNTSLAPLIAQYERLVLDRDFSARALTSTMSSFEAARQEAQRQQVYLERVVSPRAPDEARYPWRILDTLAVFGIALGVFGVWRVLAKSMGLDHAGEPL